MRECSCHFMVSWFFLLFIYMTLSLLDSCFLPRHTLLQPHTLNLLPSSKVEMMNDDPRIGRGITIAIYHCSIDFYSGKALVMKDMLETYFPGVSVNVDIQAPVLRKQQITRGTRLGAVTIIALGEHIFPMMGRDIFYLLIINNPSLWNLYILTIKLLEMTEAFEVYFNGELIFSKLKEDRFPTELELREIIGKKVVELKVEDGLGAGIFWS